MPSGYECVCDNTTISGVNCIFINKKDCYCPEFYVRDESGTCCTNATCPNLALTCDENEVYQASGLECVCDSTSGVRCVHVHKPRCYCMENYVRNDEGVCVSKDTCPEIRKY